MKEGLERLYALQLLDDKIKDTEISLKEIPAAIAAVEQERDGKVDIIEKTKKKLEGNAKEREKLEKEILLVKEKIKKYKDQMSKATTNKEYQGFTSEIKYEEDNITAIEEKIIEKMLESDEIMEEVRHSEEEFKKISEDYNKEITELKKSQETANIQLEETRKKRVAARANVEKRMLAMYDSLVKKKFGKAVSLVETEFCGVCNVKVRPQRLNELLASKEISMCESCGRLLYKPPVVEKEEVKKN